MIGWLYCIEAGVRLVRAGAENTVSLLTEVQVFGWPRGGLCEVALKTTGRREIILKKIMGRILTRF